VPLLENWALFRSNHLVTLAVGHGFDAVFGKMLTSPCLLQSKLPIFHRVGLNYYATVITITL